MNVMMALGAFQFSISTAAYTQLTRSRSWRWQAQERLSRGPVHHFTGTDAESISLNCVVYPEYIGGVEQIDQLAAQADLGIPLLMVAGTGVLLGHWVVTGLQETHSNFAAYGKPRKVEFTLSLERYEVE